MVVVVAGRVALRVVAGRGGQVVDQPAVDVGLGQHVAAAEAGAVHRPHRQRHGPAGHHHLRVAHRHAVQRHVAGVLDPEAVAHHLAHVGMAVTVAVGPGARLLQQDRRVLRQGLRVVVVVAGRVALQVHAPHRGQVVDVSAVDVGLRDGIGAGEGGSVDATRGQQGQRPPLHLDQRVGDLEVVQRHVARVRDGEGVDDELADVGLRICIGVDEAAALDQLDRRILRQCDVLVVRGGPRLVGIGSRQVVEVALVDVRLRERVNPAEAGRIDRAHGQGDRAAADSKLGIVDRDPGQGDVADIADDEAVFDEFAELGIAVLVAVDPHAGLRQRQLRVEREARDARAVGGGHRLGAEVPCRRRHVVDAVVQIGARVLRTGVQVVQVLLGQDIGRRHGGRGAHGQIADDRRVRYGAVARVTGVIQFEGGRIVGHHHARQGHVAGVRDHEGVDDGVAGIQAVGPGDQLCRLVQQDRRHLLSVAEIDPELVGVQRRDRDRPRVRRGLRPARLLDLVHHIGVVAAGQLVSIRRDRESVDTTGIRDGGLQDAVGEDVVGVEHDGPAREPGLADVTRGVAVEVVELGATDLAGDDRGGRELDRRGARLAHRHRGLERTPCPRIGAIRRRRARAGHHPGRRDVQAVVDLGHAVGRGRAGVLEGDRDVAVARAVARGRDPGDAEDVGIHRVEA